MYNYFLIWQYYLYLVQQGLLDLPVLYLSRYIIRNKAEYYHLLQAVRDNNAWEEWILFILKGIEQTAIETIQLVEGIKTLMQQYKVKLRNELPKNYSQDLLNNLFRHPYTKIAFVMQELNVSRITATTYLQKIEDLGLITKIKLGKENFYLNEKLFDLLINAFHIETVQTDSIDSNG
ncbi:MAG: Fic family protein [Phocaeicola sp.]